MRAHGIMPNEDGAMGSLRQSGFGLGLFGADAGVAAFGVVLYPLVVEDGTGDGFWLPTLVEEDESGRED